MQKRLILFGVILLLAINIFNLACIVQKNVVVCERPYLLVGTGCCLDQNDNKICDVDEERQQLTEALKKVTEIEERKGIEEIKPEETKAPAEETQPKQEPVIGKEFEPVLSEEEGYAVRLLDYDYSIISSDKARIDEMEIEIINNDPNDLWPSVNVYIYADDDPLETRTFAEENIAPSYYLPSGYKIVKKFPVSINVWNYDEDKNIKLSLYDQFDFNRRSLASSSIKVNLAEGKVVEAVEDDILSEWRREDDKLAVRVRDIKCEHVPPSYYMRSVKIEVTNKAFDDFVPVVDIKLTDMDRIKFEDAKIPMIKKGETKEINLTVDKVVPTPKLRKSFVVTIRNPADPGYQFSLSNSFDVNTFLE
jgi:hypothetical protein